MSAVPPFTVERADYAAEFDALRAVREAVFVREQHVPPALELDARDPRCLHVLARDPEGNAIGTARLVPPEPAVDGAAAPGAGATPARIGRMAVLPGWRGRGVGDAMLRALLQLAGEAGWRRVALHAQAAAIGFYLRHGFLPEGPRFMEAGIEHQTMWRSVDGTMAVADAPSAIAVVVALATAARRDLCIRSHALDPGILDAPESLDALRRLATRRGPTAIRILLRSTAAPQRNQSPLLPLAQRLPSAFAFREAVDPVDQDDLSAWIANDAGGSWHRTLGDRIAGEARLASPAHARQLRERFDRAWERGRPATEYRVLGA